VMAKETCCSTGRLLIGLYFQRQLAFSREGCQFLRLGFSYNGYLVFARIDSGSG
jgi:hypothetical protein